MSLFTDQPVDYPSIQHLAFIAEEKTKGVALNPPAKEPLTKKNWKELNFPDVCIFLYHMEIAPKEVYDSVMKLQKHLVLVDKQSQKLKLKFINYKKANKRYIIDNVQLKIENWDLETQLVNLENQLINLEKQLEDARSNKYSSLPPPSASSPPPASAFDDSDGKYKYSRYSHYFRKTKSTKLPDSPMLTDSNAAGFDINMWESKMAKELAVDIDHYDIKALRMAYMNNHVDSNVYKHLAAKSRIGARKPFATAEKMFKVLQKAYSDVNWQHTAMNKFRDLKMIKDFNSFWAEFQVLASELDYNESTLINELKFKLTPLLSQAMADGVSQPKDIYKYAKQCQEAYQNLKDIEIQTLIANFIRNWYNQRLNTNANTNISTNANAKMTNHSEHPANFSYNHPPPAASNPTVAMHLACSKATKLTKEKIVKLQYENRYFHCKVIENHWPWCPKEWRSMIAITNSTVLALVNVSEMAVLQPDHVEAENV